MRFEQSRRRSLGRVPSALVCAGLLIVALALVVASCGGGTTTTTAASGTTAGPATTGGTAAGGAQVSIKGFAFNPAAVTIKVGETVTWTNNDGTTHDVTSDSGGFQASGSMAQGATYTATFDKAGTFPYHCGIHPNMKATVTVQ